MGLGQFFNFINSHHNSPQDTGTQNSSDNGEPSYFDGDDEKWPRNLMEEDEFLTDEPLDGKTDCNLDDETLDDVQEDDVQEDDENYVHDLRTHEKQLLKAHLEQLNAGQTDSAQNKENKLVPTNVLVNEESEKEPADEQMELDGEQRDKRLKADAQSPNQNYEQTTIEHLDGQSDLDD